MQRVNIRRFSRTDCLAPSDLSLEALLHPPLTLPRQVPGEPPILEHRVLQQPKLSMLHLAAAAAPTSVSPLASHADTDVQHAAGVAGANPSPQPPAVKAEPEPFELLGSVSFKATDDMYGDLGLQHRASESSPSAQQEPRPPTQDQPPQQEAGGLTVQQQAHECGKTEVAGAVLHRFTPTTGATGLMQAAHKPVDNAGTSSLQALLASPATLQALLKDPVQLQRLLEKHPSLITLLKSKLGKR